MARSEVGSVLSQAKRWAIAVLRFAAETIATRDMRYAQKRNEERLRQQMTQESESAEGEAAASASKDVV
jgi:hypothetical protein